ncbi:VirD4-like conjugal transfer protein, CD1115 family [Streptococcus dentiloxodontae]
MNGTILGVLDKKVIYQDNETRPNRNVFVVGGPGSFKTQSVVITNALAETENSLVLTDPKGEVYELTAGIKERQGYEVHVVNFMDMTRSSRYNPLDYVTKDIHATEVATKIVDSANSDGKKDVWYYSQRTLLRALILYAIYELPPVDRNFRGITDFLQNYDVEEEEDGSSQLDKAFMSLDRRHPARRAYELGFKKSTGRMRNSIIMSLLTTIADFVDDEVANFTSFSDFHLQDIGRKKIALYIIIPVMDNAFEGLVNLFITQLFSQLYLLGAENGSKLPRQVDFIFDEFVNLGKFPNFEEFLATCRGYGIGVTTICQTITQLQDKYSKEKAESILGNHNVKICLTASNETTAKYFSKLLGQATVKIETESKSDSKSGDIYSVISRQTGSAINENVNYSSRSLMNPDEIMRLAPDTSIIVFNNRPPIRAKKAFQFELFPEAVTWFPKSQKDYHPMTSPLQIERFRESERLFQEKLRNQQGIPNEIVSEDFSIDGVEVPDELLFSE